MKKMKERFLSDIKDHKMTILKDDGVYRHVKFKKPGTIACSFSLVTWPGYLAISGDMGDYVFSRLEDMFDFFETSNGELRINLGYWCEKMKAVSRFGSSDGKINKFDSVGTWENVKDYAKEILEDEDEIEDFETQLVNADTDIEAISIMEEAGLNDSWESVQYNPTFHVQWALFAIAWGIMEYKNKKS